MREMSTMRLWWLCVVAAVALAAGADVDVIIIGAGVSGVSAAVTLKAANVSVILVEATDHIGGRIHAMDLGGISIELGANWIHGTRGDSNLSGPGTNDQLNPVWEVATKLNLRTSLIPGSSDNVTGYNLYHSNGSALMPKVRAERSARIMKTFDCVNKTGKDLTDGHDISFGAALAKCGWETHDEIDTMTEWEITAADYILTPNVTSLFWTLPDPTYTTFGPDDHLVHDPRGYSTVVRAMATDGGITPDDIKFNAVVTSIKLSPPGDDGVVVGTADGRTFSARAAIVTLPLGVMQHKHSEIFQNPPLPPSQIAALQAVTMGNFTKIFMRWPTQFWPSRGAQWLVAHSPVDIGHTEPIEFHDLGAIDDTLKGTIFTYVVDKAAALWESRSDEEAIEALLVRLEAALGVRGRVPRPDHFYMTRHGSDPLRYGAYTAMRLGVTSATFDAMIAPLLGSDGGQARVFFAGEHTCSALTGYVHGGFYSGLRAAAEALRLVAPKSVNMSAVGMSNHSVHDLHMQTYNGQCEQLSNRASIKH